MRIPAFQLVYRALLCFLLTLQTALGQHTSPKTIVNFGGSHFPRTVSLSDLDKDGDIDVLSHNRFKNKPIVYALNSGGGNTFTIFNLPGSDQLGSIGYITVADLDKNGFEDVIAVTCNRDVTNKVIVWYNSGTNIFSRPIEIIQGLNTSSDSQNDRVHVADIDIDGYLDILLPNMSSTYKMFWVKNNGRYGTWQVKVIDSIKGAPQSSIADLDGDGLLEILGSNNTLNLYSGRSFEKMTVLTTETINRTALLTKDVDGDGDLDIIAGTVQWDSGIVWLENLGSLNFEKHLIENSTGNFENVIIGDFNHDGLPDLLAGCYTDCPFTYFINNGNGGFTRTVYEQYTSAVSDLYDTALGDLDGDGKKDLVVADAREHAVRWYKSSFEVVDVIEANFKAPDIACHNAIVSFTDLSTGSNIVSWNWSFGDGNTANGQNAEHSYANSGVYEVVLTVHDASGQTKTKKQTLTINRTPDATITIIGNQLEASEGDAYKWYHDGAQIDSLEASTRTITALEEGQYMVEVSANGCSTTSEEVTILVSGIEDVVLPSIKLFPNPTHDLMQVTSEDRYISRIDIYSINGSKIKGNNFQIEKRQVQYSFTDLRAGLYLVVVTLDNGLSSRHKVVRL